MEWREFSACRGIPFAVAQRLFFGSGPRVQARAICADCPVRLDCLQDALETEEMGINFRFGIRGGLSGAQRQALMLETLTLYGRNGIPSGVGLVPSG